MAGIREEAATYAEKTTALTSKLLLTAFYHQLQAPGWL